MQQESEEDWQQDLDWISRKLTDHPEFPIYWMTFVVTAYMAWQIVPGVMDPKARWAYLIFLLPLALMAIALGVMIGKLTRAVHLANKRDAEAKRLNNEAEGRLQQQCSSAVLENGAAQRPPDAVALTPEQQEEAGLRSGPHQPGECPGPPHFPGPAGEGYWVDELCGSYWQWRGDRWVQA